jgi:hypothetical protein
MIKHELLDNLYGMPKDDAEALVKLEGHEALSMPHNTVLSWLARPNTIILWLNDTNTHVLLAQPGDALEVE